jgi:hypothetical protein
VGIIMPRIDSARLSLGWRRYRAHQVLCGGAGPGTAGRDTCHQFAERRGIAAGDQHLTPHGRLSIALLFAISAGKIIDIDVVTDPERLRQLDLAILEK